MLLQIVEAVQKKTAFNSYLYQSRIWWTKKDAYFLYEVLMQALIVAKQE